MVPFLNISGPLLNWAQCITQINSKRKYIYKKLVMEKLVVLDTAHLRNRIEEREAVTGKSGMKLIRKSLHIVDFAGSCPFAVIHKGLEGTHVQYNE